MSLSRLWEVMMRWYRGSPGYWTDDEEEDVIPERSGPKEDLISVVRDESQLRA